MTPFNIPSLPTDNLYKFYAITGITIATFSVLFFIISTVKLNEDLDNIETRINIITLETDFFEEDFEDFEEQSYRLQKELELYDFPGDSIENKYQLLKVQLDKLRTDSSYREYLAFLQDYQRQVFPEFYKHEELIKLKHEITTTQRKLKLKNAELVSNIKKSKRKFWELILIFIVGFLTFIYGYRLAYKGFKLWRIYVQDVVDKKLKIELEILEFEKEEKTLLK